jgi:hypothetical protein
MAAQKTLPSEASAEALLAAVPDDARRADAQRLCGAGDRYPKLLKRLSPHKLGKGCLYLKRLDAVDPDVLRALVERTVRVHRGADRPAGAA